MKAKNMENKNNASAVGSGFMLGLLLGVILTLFITTKKGREILKELIDKGIQKISELDGLRGDDMKTSQHTDPENDYVKPNSEDVKKEIRYLVADSSADKITHTSQPKKQTEEKQSNGKVNTRQGKSNKRVFFQRTKKKN